LTPPINTNILPFEQNITIMAVLRGIESIRWSFRGLASELNTAFVPIIAISRN
jgi:hypothetical protein